MRLTGSWQRKYYGHDNIDLKIMIRRYIFPLVSGTKTGASRDKFSAWHRAQEFVKKH